MALSTEGDLSLLLKFVPKKIQTFLFSEYKLWFLLSVVRKMKEPLENVCKRQKLLFFIIFQEF